jgi:diguanylate cyclase (GGDEF)-like protein
MASCRSACSTSTASRRSTTASGHVAGDEVLRAVARGFANLRLHDDAFRIGGDEFAVIMPGSDPGAARAAVRRVVDGLDLGDLTTRGVSLGVSFGVAAGATDPKALHAAADFELTAAKRRRHLTRVPDPSERSDEIAEVTVRSVSG